MSAQHTWAEVTLRAKLAMELEQASFHSEDMIPIIELETALKIVRGISE